MFQWVKLRGSTLYKGLGAVLLLSIKWLRLTGAIGTGLSIPDEMFIHIANLQ